ncbi:hypothetical protein [Echinicola rosea]|uniref:Uncharacterized protein n=1 Tax=Echinicola rosea TaxID=1807691 RepID=A0ABQ1V8S1_9BACT|nr:hypothetical protein [Echinicola rosea]GGF44045.1 hypothetical protein GCM10011339_35680 [Echinicola rosea]
MFDLDKFGPKKCGITPEKVREIFKNHGEEISHEESRGILEVMCFLAKLAVDQIVNEHECS